MIVLIFKFDKISPKIKQQTGFLYIKQYLTMINILWKDCLHYSLNFKHYAKILTNPNAITGWNK